MTAMSTNTVSAPPATLAVSTKTFSRDSVKILREKAK